MRLLSRSQKKKKTVPTSSIRSAAAGCHQSIGTRFFGDDFKENHRPWQSLGFPIGKLCSISPLPSSRISRILLPVLYQSRPALFFLFFELNGFSFRLAEAVRSNWRAVAGPSTSIDRTARASTPSAGSATAAPFQVRFYFSLFLSPLSTSVFARLHLSFQS